MSRTKTVLYSIFYGFLAILFFVIAMLLSKIYNFSEMSEKLVFSFISVIILSLYLKFNIINYENSNEIKLLDKLPMLPLYSVLILLFFTDPYYPIMNSMVLKAVFISFLIGISEEVLFRGVIYNLFYYNKIIFLMISSLLFGLLHYDQGDIGIIFASLVGLALGMARLSKTPLWILILTHAMIDIPTMIMKNYDYIYSFETKLLRYHGLKYIGLFTIIVFGIYIEYKKVWKFDFKGEKLESKSIWKYFIS